MDTIREWVDSAAIRWGSDADFREALLGLKDFKQNTWEFGFDRLLSGYAFADEELYEGSLSTGVGGDGLVLGRFKNFVDALFSINKELQLKHTTEDWVILLQKIHDDFFYDNYETATERGLILVAIAELEKNWGLSQLSMELPPEIVLKSLGSSLEEQRSSFGFLDKGVTFCTLLPMRSIPSKVVCLLGINEGVFPRLDRRSGFDLMFKNWQQGDRSVRLDDRYIFLESLLSAEDSFYVSYIGQSEKDNSPIPPSIILAELLDFLKSNMPSFAVLEHPLQAYSNRYFTGGLPSFSYKNFTAALAHISHGAEQAPFCKEALSLPDSDDDLREVKLADLIDFYKHPARHFLKKQLNTSLFQEEKSELEVDEAFDSPTGLENYQLSVELHEDLSDIIHNLKAQEPPLSSERLQEEVEESKAALRQRYIASGRFPYGEAGKKTFDKKFDELSEFTIALMNRENNRQEWQTEIDIPVPQLGLRLIGDIERLFGGDYLPFRLGKEAIKHQLPEIIKYLALCSNEHSKTSVQSMIYQSIDNTSQVPISVAAESLQDLNYFLSLYLDGLQKPLPFIPACFEKYQGKIKGNNPEKEQEQGIKAAYTQWAERGFGSPVQPECENEVNKLCFTEQFPGYNPDFQDNFMALLEGVSEIFSKYKWTGEAK